jgi:F-type H+-transporting ATPase subunit epsilon
LAEESLHVELVAADRTVWSGEAAMVIAKTTDGEIGILPGHTPLLGVLVNGTVQIRPESGDAIVAAVHGGFLSVANNQVGVLAELAELADEIDVARAREALTRAQQTLEDDAEAREAAERALARIRAHGDAF